jgi:phosphatidylserine synthase
MKNLNYLNYFFVGLPITLILLGFLIDPHQGNLIGYGLVSSMFTGLFQFVIGLKMLIDEPYDKHLQIYITAVILFFALWFTNAKIGYYNFITYTLFSIPPTLAIYLSIIIYKKANK